MVEYELLKKDIVRIYCFNETVNDKSTSLVMYLESDGNERNYLQVRNAGANSFQFNNFVVTEKPEENCIEFKPNVVGCPAYIKINSGNDVRIELIRNGANAPESEVNILAGETKIEYSPEGYSKYHLYIHQLSTAMTPEDMQSMAETSHRELYALKYDNEKLLQDITDTNAEIDEFKRKKNQLSEEKSALSEEKNSLSENVVSLNKEIEQIADDKLKLTDDKAKLIEKLDKIKEEYDKDYEVYRDEIEEIKRNYDVDAEILKYYEDKEVTPIEDLIENAKKDIGLIEEQIRLFVDAKARKTASIENELRIGKKE